jgi:hypothetical protein
VVNKYIDFKNNNCKFAFFEKFLKKSKILLLGKNPDPSIVIFFLCCLFLNCFFTQSNMSCSCQKTIQKNEEVFSFSKEKKEKKTN